MLENRKLQTESRKLTSWFWRKQFPEVADFEFDSDSEWLRLKRTLLQRMRLTMLRGQDGSL